MQLRRFRGLAPLLLLAACSTQEEPLLPDGRCLKEQGCPATSALPTCPEGPEALSVEEAWARVGSTSEGQRVRIRGSLGVLFNLCTLMGCGEDRCCNRCSTTFGLGAPDALQERRPRETIQLGGEGIGCYGDESLSCCAVEPNGQEVIADGTLFKADERQYLLFEATLCAPASPR